MREIRSNTAEFTTDNNKLSGYASVFNRPYTIVESGRTYTEIIKPGAFTRSLANKTDFLICFNHDTNRLLGRTSSGTAKVYEDAIGLRFEVDLPESELQVRELVKRGDLTGASFAFTVAANGQVWEKNTRIISDVELYECGPVVTPASPATNGTVAIRSNGIKRSRLELLAKEM